MDKVLNMTFTSSLTNLCEINSSFDTGILRICYTGKNRNGSFISKDAINRSLKTIYNCPIVCNYDRDTDTFGGHDVEVATDEDGLHIVNLTQPIGCIPESAKVWFEDYEEEDGTVNEYLYAEVLLWKRQEAYRKIKRDGVSQHSMEISVKNGCTVDGVYVINDFEFTAFAIIGVEPCFEGSALEMFTKQSFKNQLSEMMADIKENFQAINSSFGVIDRQFTNSTEGGKKALDERLELLSTYGIDADSLDFSIEDYSIEELTERFEAMRAAADSEPVDSEANADTETDSQSADYSLTSNLMEEIYRALESETMQREWGECNRYYYVDSDLENNEIYCWDGMDWLLYGFSFTLDGDKVVIDFGCKKRKKYTIVDFDEGEQNSPFAGAFTKLEEIIHNNAEISEKYQAASQTIASMETELDELRKFKADTEDAIAKDERDKVLALFADLVGIEAFDELSENCEQYSIEELEEKCYAIRGRNSTNTKFGLDVKTPKLKVENSNIAKEPYGGIVERLLGKTNQ